MGCFGGQELKQSLPHLVLQPLPRDSPPCGSRDLLYGMLHLLQREGGGVLLGANVILARLPRLPDLHRRGVWFAFSPQLNPDAGSGRLDFTRGVVIATKDFDEDARQSYMRQIVSSSSAVPQCVTPAAFDSHAPDSEENAPCVAFHDKPDVYPVGIMYANSSFGQLARWMFYGTRSPMHPRTKQGAPIPRISHVIWFSPDSGAPSTMEFYQYLTVLSALYVGGFHHVYVHGNAGFSGPWWQRLKGENVTFVWMEEPEMVYQQEVKNPSHKSDVTR